jgi:DNA polymerase III delta prime subunit
MDSLQSLFPKDLYHSYVIEGDPETTVFAIREFLQERGDIQKDTPDVLCQLYDSFSIEDSKSIRQWHSESKGDDNKKICIIGAQFINHDAERTLLKIIEEPHSGTHFFIVVPNSSMLLDTILSRVHTIKLNKEENPISKKSALEFYKSTPESRIELVAAIIEENKDNVGSGQLRASAIQLVNGLERIVYKKFQDDRNDSNTKFILSELNKARDYLALPGCSPKMILEHISLVL